MPPFPKAAAAAPETATHDMQLLTRNFSAPPAAKFGEEPSQNYEALPSVSSRLSQAVEEQLSPFGALPVACL